MCLTMKHWKMIGLLCCLLGAAGYGRSDAETMNESQPMNYYFEMDAARQVQIRSALQHIKIGEKQQRIMVALGKPDYDHSLTTKDGEFIVRVLTYYFKRWEKGMVNENKDKRVLFEFDANDKLDRIVSNVDGIPSRK